MKKPFIHIICLLILMGLDTSEADACTNVIVTGGASKDGSCMISYSADSQHLYGELSYQAATTWPKGSMRSVYDWDTGYYLGEIPQIDATYQTVGNMNQHQLIIAESTFGGRSLSNKNGILDYGSLIYITLQRAGTAREAIRILDELMQEYGYASSGESFSIADKEEAWIMEIIGKGDEKGSVWVALRIPDGYISAHANQSRITTFPKNDPDNCLYSPDVIEFARKKGFFKGTDEEFSFRDAYFPVGFDRLRYCESRVWSAFRLLGGANFNADSYVDYAMGHNPSNRMPLWIKPDRPLEVKDIERVMRDHFEGTVLDASEDFGAGPSRTPYRWRPMSFKVDGQEYVFERSISAQQTGFWFIAQSRGWMPDEVGGLMWFGVDDSGTSPVTPVYASINRVPLCFEHGNGSFLEYSPTSAFWQCNRVTHFAYLFYDRVAPEILRTIDEYEIESRNLVKEMDDKALALVKNGRVKKARKMLTEFCQSRTDKMMLTWNNLENYLLVKYMDGNIKYQNPDGSFKDNGGTEHNIPQAPEQPAFRERWLRGVVSDHGDVMEVK